MAETYIPGETTLNPNEVWKDDEGTLYTPIGERGPWLAFGRKEPLTDADLTFWFPLTKVVDKDGKVLVSDLDYSTL